MFQGVAALKLDAKGRMTVPTQHRAALERGCACRVTITPHQDGCLLMVPQPLWEQEAKRIINTATEEAKELRRLYIGFADSVEVDSTGRVLLSSELREEAGIDRDVKLLGVGEHFEIWDPERLRQHKEALKARSRSGTAASLF